MAKLVYTDQGEEIEFRLDQGRSAYTVGRNPMCDLRINNPSISRKHIEIRFDGASGKYAVYDLNSSNGTYVNGKRESSATLKNGDEIIVGEFKIIFHDAKAAKVEPPPAPKAPPAASDLFGGKLGGDDEEAPLALDSIAPVGPGAGGARGTIAGRPANIAAAMSSGRGDDGLDDLREGLDNGRHDNPARTAAHSPVAPPPVSAPPAGPRLSLETAKARATSDPGDELRAELERMKTALKHETDRANEATADGDRAHAELERVKLQFAEAQRQLKAAGKREEVEEELREAKDDLERLKRNLAERDKRIRTLQEEVDSLRLQASPDELRELREKNAKMRDAFRDLSDELQALISTNQRLMAKIEG